MALSSTYVARETGTNLVRNLVMTIAAIVTMAVSLSALGGVLIMRQAINKASLQWRGGVEMSIWMKSNASEQEISAVRHELVALETPAGGVKSFRYVDKPAAYSEFKTMFANQPLMIQQVSAADMPPSFRVVPNNTGGVEQLGNQFSKQPGVQEVRYAKQIIDALSSHFSALRSVALAIALLVMVGAIALIVNTTQLAIFARRREVGVMKLVGATNWFIRVPFMLEGLVHGLAGAAAAFVVTYLARDSIASFVGNNPYSPSGALFVTGHEAVMTGVFIAIVGVAVGSLGSAFAVRRFLAV